MHKKELQRFKLYLLEQRVRYYHFDKPIITDFDYDMQELRYAEECKELGIKNIFEGMVGVPLKDKDVQRIIKKLSNFKSHS